MRPCPRTVAIVIPARNEAERIASCLEALRPQLGCSARIYLVVNNSSDDTAARARAVFADAPHLLRVIEAELRPEQGVGMARQIGCRAAIHRMPKLRFMLNTDADCIAGRNWVAAMCAALEDADAVCGFVTGNEAEASLLARMDLTRAALEGTYRKLVLGFFERHSQIDGSLGHGEASGANLGLRVDAYLKAGGFEDTRCGEDRALVRALRRAGLRIRYIEDAVVQASLRLTGRASGGMADALNARVSQADYCIDECLPPARWLWQHRRSLPPWPHTGEGYAPLHVDALAEEICQLQARLAQPCSALPSSPVARVLSAADPISPPVPQSCAMQPIQEQEKCPN